MKKTTLSFLGKRYQIKDKSLKHKNYITILTTNIKNPTKSSFVGSNIFLSFMILVA